MKAILSGNEAVARGAWEAGVTIASAYPGTPSTEILESMSQYKKDIHCQWANNEKVAFEIVVGSAIGGARSLCSMKHVGMNVAADPIFSAAYAGVNGGLVTISADDPGCHSSQNEQDNRLYAQHAKLGMLEPTDSQECKDFAKVAFELSEQFDLVMLLRMTTRVCHSKSIVELGVREEVGVKPYFVNHEKYTMLPVNARHRHVMVEQSLEDLEEYAATSPLNRVEINDSEIGIVTSGVSYLYAKEAFGDSASYLKFGITYPLSKKMIQDFCKKHKTIYIIEEGEPYLETMVRSLGFSCTGKDKISIQGELDAQIVREAFGLSEMYETYKVDAVAPTRAPVLCAGCPHRGFFHAMGRYKNDIVAVGDIGCYGLGVNPPHNGFGISICMGAGFSIPIGLAKALEMRGDKRKVFGMVGDSTFFHSGINSMIDAIHSKANVCLCVLDNSITAMTGHQVNAGNETNIMGYEVPGIDLVSIIKATGLEEDHFRVVDPIDLTAMDSAIKEAIALYGTFVIITKHPCALIKEVMRKNAGKHCHIDPDKCKGCKLCMKIACPSLAFENGKAYVVDPANCNACGLCIQMCKFDAIEKVGEQA